MTKVGLSIASDTRRQKNKKRPLGAFAWVQSYNNFVVREDSGILSGIPYYSKEQLRLHALGEGLRHINPQTHLKIEIMSDSKKIIQNCRSGKFRYEIKNKDYTTIKSNREALTQQLWETIFLELERLSSLEYSVSFSYFHKEYTYLYISHALKLCRKTLRERIQNDTK